VIEKICVLFVLCSYLLKFSSDRDARCAIDSTLGNFGRLDAIDRSFSACDWLGIGPGEIGEVSSGTSGLDLLDAAERSELVACSGNA